jgi:hypothetical protein
MQEFFNPDKADLLRETIIILFGLLHRWFTLRKLKKQQNND